MKDIIFNLSDKFSLMPSSMVKFYELEYGVSKIVFNHEPLEGFVYKLHKEQDDGKAFVVLEKTENGLEYLIEPGFLNKETECLLQVSATSEDKQIISNMFKITIGRFINAEDEPSPEKMSEIDKLLIKAEVLAEKADKLETLEVEEIDNGIRVHFDGVDYDILNGEQGEKGDPFKYEDFTPEQLEEIKGKDGVSPTARVFQLKDGARIVIEDAQGTTSATVKDGKGASYIIKWDGRTLTHDGEEIRYTRDIADVITRLGAMPVITTGVSEELIYQLVKLELSREGDYTLTFSNLEYRDSFIFLQHIKLYPIPMYGGINVVEDDVQVATDSSVLAVRNRLNKLNQQAVKSVNGITPDEEGNVEIAAGDGKVKTVNNIEPDDKGNIAIDVGVSQTYFDDTIDPMKDDIARNADNISTLSYNDMINFETINEHTDALEVLDGKTDALDQKTDALGKAIGDAAQALGKEISDVGALAASKASQDDVDGLSTRVDTLDDETLELIQKTENIEAALEAYDANFEAFDNRISSNDERITEMGQVLLDKADIEDVYDKTTMDNKLGEYAKYTPSGEGELDFDNPPIYTKNAYEELDNQSVFDAINSKTSYDDTEIRQELTETNNALSELPTDVQINGTSILNDEKVANIPIAGRNVSGVVKANTSFGFSTSTEGELQVYNEDSFINARLVRTPLALNKLDYAVKQAMCDGKGAEWTDTEKASARQRIGLDKEWVLKGTLTTENKDTGINVDLTGCTEITFNATVSATGASAFGTNVYNLIQNFTTNGTRYIVAKFSNYFFGLHCDFVRSGNGVSAGASLDSYDWTNGKNLSEVNLFKFSNPTVITSCNIKIYAR